MLFGRAGPNQSLSPIGKALSTIRYLPPSIDTLFSRCSIISVNEFAIHSLF